MVDTIFEDARKTGGDPAAHEVGVIESEEVKSALSGWHTPNLNRNPPPPYTHTQGNQQKFTGRKFYYV